MSSSLSSGASSFAVTRIAAPVRTQVERHLRQAILSGHFRPGDRLIARELCELFGVSRTALREALRSLEGHGLVVTIPQKGLVVATMTLQEAEEIYRVRAAKALVRHFSIIRQASMVAGAARLRIQLEITR
jgi:DNA-binding GntR family transcriptional regulator